MVTFETNSDKALADMPCVIDTKTSAFGNDAWASLRSPAEPLRASALRNHTHSSGFAWESFDFSPITLQKVVSANLPGAPMRSLCSRMIDGFMANPEALRTRRLKEFAFRVAVSLGRIDEAVAIVKTLGIKASDALERESRAQLQRGNLLLGEKLHKTAAQLKVPPVLMPLFCDEQSKDAKFFVGALLHIRCSGDDFIRVEPLAPKPGRGGHKEVFSAFQEELANHGFPPQPLQKRGGAVIILTPGTKTVMLAYKSKDLGPCDKALVSRIMLKDNGFADWRFEFSESIPSYT